MLTSQRIRVLLAGIFSQILCVGVARFAYTPLLPIMQEQTWMGDAAGGWLAAVNYLGYISGALIAASINDLKLKDTLYRIGLILAVTTTAAMAMTENLTLWMLLRYLSGLASAGSMLIASGLILNWLIRHDHRGELGIHFAGIGLGIAIAALAVELMMYLRQGWAEQWLWLSLLGLILAIPAWSWLPRPEVGNTTSSGTTLVDNPPTNRFMWLMLAAYFCAGYGYVITATFIVAFVERQPELVGMGPMAFVLVGLAAAPAVMLWDIIARHTGYLNALLLTLVLQVGGILLPVVFPTLSVVFLSAMLFGGTFIGSVSLVLTMAGRLYPTKPAKLMGKMTISYGSAQVIAPALTGMLAAKLGNYDLGLWIAGGFVVVGLLLVLWLKFTDQTAQQLDASAKLSNATR
ncbi:YbfB/YjiJ family MFS transporter [Marinospirillum minutulum]|uniref:YbfB/YjiJ family MFS transporter n=1 Tax=Marinospirillum minutulum TaxID=64974 RepID=UPI000401DDDD|nr:YbfB/YjiJ family MFS transporter [Marinospirillum minutulum]